MKACEPFTYQQETVQRAHVAGVERDRLRVVRLGQLHVLKSALRELDLCVSLEVDVVVGVLQDQLLAAERRLGELLFGDVELA